MPKYAALVLSSVLFLAGPIHAGEKLDFWQQQRRGANGDGGTDFEKWFQAASQHGIEFVRLSPATWKATQRDFLFGNVDCYERIQSDDLKTLGRALDVAQKHNVKVVLTTFSLPGLRWKQHNGDRFDYRLWNEERYQSQACAFWKELAGQMRNHPAVVGYNPLNEPHPERMEGFESPDDEGFLNWFEEQRNKTADLNRFYARIIAAIRSVDRETPIVLDTAFHAAPDGFEFLERCADRAVLYSFHFYHPWTYTTWRVNKNRFSYPDRMPTGGADKTRAWTADDLESRIAPVEKWLRTHDIPRARIMAGEFGCDRRVAGAKEYLSDVVRMLNAHGWHWAFYSFRSADWDGMDYELGTEALGGKYWQAREQGKSHEQAIERRDNPLWHVLQRELRGDATHLR